MLQADRMALAIGSSTAGGTGRITLRATTAGRLVDLGSARDTTANLLELSNSELATITTTGVLQIGTGSEGDVSITAPLSVGAGTLSILNGGAITETGSLTTANLRLSTLGPVTLNGANNVGVLAAALTGANAAMSFNNVGSLQIGNVDAVSGITTLNGDVTVTTVTGDLTLNNNLNAGSVPLPAMTWVNVKLAAAPAASRLTGALDVCASATVTPPAVSRTLSERAPVAMALSVVALISSGLAALAPASPTPPAALSTSSPWAPPASTRTCSRPRRSPPA